MSIYTPKGKAGEYAKLALNLYSTCPHHCRYCFVPQQLHKTGAEFWQPARPRVNILSNTQNWLRRNPQQPRHPVHLCFTCDPYPMGSLAFHTREAIKLLHTHGFPVQILTKNGKDAVRDFDLLTVLDTFGVTIVAPDNTTSKREWEPDAPPAGERLQALKTAYQMGINTWVSIEPVVDELDAIAVMEEVAPYAKTVYLGKLNHPTKAQLTPEQWRRIDRAAQFLKLNYKLKADTAGMLR